MRPRATALPGLLVVLGLAGCPGPMHRWPVDRSVSATAPALSPVAVLLPFVNLSGSAEARSKVMPQLRALLGQVGYRVVPDEQVAGYLESKRIRYLDGLSAQTLDELASRFGAGWVMSGAVLTCLDGPHPVVALEARLLSVQNRLVWWNVIGLTPEDTSGIFELGRLDSLPGLVAEAVRQLGETLPKPGQRSRVRSPHPAPTLGREPASFLSPWFPTQQPLRVAVLPLENRTEDKRASWIMADVLSRQLTASGRFAVVSPSELRSAMVAEDVRSLWGLASDQLKAVGARLGTPLFLRGAVHAFRDASARVEGAPIEVQVELTLVDVEHERILWMVEHHRLGEEYEVAFEKGGLTDVVSLADQVAAELVRAEGKLAVLAFLNKQPPLAAELAPPLASPFSLDGGPTGSGSDFISVPSRLRGDGGVTDAGAADGGLRIERSAGTGSHLDSGVGSPARSSGPADGGH